MAIGDFGSESKPNIGGDFTINQYENASANYQKVSDLDLAGSTAVLNFGSATPADYAGFILTFTSTSGTSKSFIFAIENQDRMKNEVFNVGSWSMNYSKKDICEMIQEKTDCFVHYADFDGDADKRDYVVSYDKIKNIGYECTLGVERGIDELIRVFPTVKIKNKYRN